MEQLCRGMEQLCRGMEQLCRGMEQLCRGLERRVRLGRFRAAVRFDGRLTIDWYVGCRSTSIAQKPSRTLVHFHANGCIRLGVFVKPNRRVFRKNRGPEVRETALQILPC